MGLLSSVNSLVCRSLASLSDRALGDKRGLSFCEWEEVSVLKMVFSFSTLKWFSNSSGEIEHSFLALVADFKVFQYALGLSTLRLLSSDWTFSLWALALEIRSFL